MGLYAGNFNTTGTNNNFFGCYAGCCNTTGSSNIFMGEKAGRFVTTGSRNVFLGRYAGGVGGYGHLSASSIVIGDYATGYYGNDGTGNIFMGQYVASGRQNCGNHNIYLGTYAGSLGGLGDPTGSNVILIGQHAGSDDGSSLFDIGTESNRIVLGNSAHTCAQIQIAWTTVSDCRDKCIFGSVPHGRGFLQNVEPIEYAFKNRETGCITDPEGKRRYGFSAQNVLAAEGDTPVIVSAANAEKLQLTSDYIIPVLVNAVNELSAEVELLKARLAVLEAK